MSTVTTAPWHKGGGGVSTAMSRTELASFFRRLLTSDTYRQMLEKKLNSGTLEAPIHAMLYHYGYGKPPETLNLNIAGGQEDLSSLSTDELTSRLDDIKERLAQANAIEAQIVQVTH